MTEMQQTSTIFPKSSRICFSETSSECCTLITTVWTLRGLQDPFPILPEYSAVTYKSW